MRLYSISGPWMPCIIRQYSLRVSSVTAHCSTRCIIIPRRNQYSQQTYTNKRSFSSGVINSNKSNKTDQSSKPSSSSISYHFTMPHIVDDKSPHVIPFILDRYKLHRQHSSAPFFIGLNGVQGIGKSTLVESLAATLRSEPHNLQTLTLSIDDFYLPAADLATLASNNPTNPLLQQRGQPSTHDAQLAQTIFSALKSRTPNIRVPVYDKSANAGRGDRKPKEQWKVVNAPAASSGEAASSSEHDHTVDVVIFEGWCVGFRALNPAALEETWRRARRELLAASASTCADTEDPGPEKPLRDERVGGRLGALALPHVQVVNDALREQGYEELFTGFLDAFVYLDAEDPFYVYAWRGEQEDELRKDKGEASAMTKEQVKKFVDGYFPAYEVYVERIRAGIFRGGGGEGKAEEGMEGAQMRLIIGRDRSVLDTEVV